MGGGREGLGLGWDGTGRGGEGWVSEAVTCDFKNNIEMMRNGGWWKWRT